MNMFTAYDRSPIPTLAVGIAAKINALHADVRRLEKQSRKTLDDAVAAAWQAGKLLNDAKKSITRYGGHGAWMPWIESEFHGGLRTAHRYMRLAREVTDPASLAGMSLRQVYFRLGIATEPKQATTFKPASKLPAHICLANKLVRLIRRSRGKINARDLAALYADLRKLFDAQHVV